MQCVTLRVPVIKMRPLRATDVQVVLAVCALCASAVLASATAVGLESRPVTTMSSQSSQRSHGAEDSVKSTAVVVEPMPSPAVGVTHQSAGASANRSFVISGDVFLRDGKPFQVLSGSVHYFRHLPSAVPARLRAAKLCGLNAGACVWRVNQCHATGNPSAIAGLIPQEHSPIHLFTISSAAPTTYFDNP
jgi:hypothetical protein